MNGVISPYHLTTREAPALVGLLLCDQSCTILPEVDALEDLAVHPHLARLLERWEWLVPLWEDGAIGTNPSETYGELLTTVRRIDSDTRYEALRPLMHAELLESSGAHLDLLVSDLLRAGPSPGVSIPIMHAMDRIGARTEAWICRPDPSSVVERAEVGAMRQIGAFAMPALLEASGERILEARESLEPELESLRQAISQGEDARAVTVDLQRAFDRERESLIRTEDALDARTVAGMVSVRLYEHDAELSLRASVASARRFARLRSDEGNKALPVPYDPMERAPVRSMVIRVLARHPA